MAQDAKKTKFFCIATEGATTDGRKIDRQMLEQMASSYDPKKYGARINMEHIRGIYPDSAFRAYGDVIALKTDKHEGISFHPSKTVNSSGVRLLIEMTPDLRETLDRARGGKITAIGPVICTHAGGRFTYIGAYSGWKRACQRARLAYEKDCEEKRITPDPRYLIGMHFHDLRAKALTDLKRQRGAAAAQSLAGHTTESMTAHYTKSREVERVQPVPLARLS
ncbi:GPO family capsid scaffolding protein [Burkholderia plantarii]|uniref:GPO family capsid scaffolding protein n=1 Tax=Burkholderia plantarii TaxID=41899 RepID=UPI0007069A8B|nr:GPO family capsid scaffolding protein [Burkholderia plantarii]ALK34391.1 phage integrase [Burkholderia plantarii]GLZ21338.1 hypothetical protein Bpla01_48670 [Burkholderia plantarii]